MQTANGSKQEPYEKIMINILWENLRLWNYLDYVLDKQISRYQSKWKWKQMTLRERNFLDRQYMYKYLSITL